MAQRFVSKAALSRGARWRARRGARLEAQLAEEYGQAPKVYRRVSEANPGLSRNEVRQISHEANVRTAQSGRRSFDDPDLSRKAARKAMKLGYKANEALKGGAGVTKDTVGAIRRAVIRMGSWTAKAAKGASAGLPSEIVTEGGKMVDRAMERVKARRAKRREKVAAVRAGR